MCNQQALMPHASFCRIVEFQRFIILNLGDALAKLARKGREAGVSNIKTSFGEEQ